MTGTGNPPARARTGGLAWFLSTGFGMIVVLLVLWSIYAGISAVWHRIYPPPPVAALALTAYFEPVDGQPLPRSEEFPLEEEAAEAAASAKKGEGPSTGSTAPVLVPPPGVGSRQRMALRVSGQVQRAGKPVAEGRVRITVLGPRGQRQSFLRQLEGGAFGLFDPPSLRNLDPESELRVDARVWSAQFGEESAAETVYVNTQPGVSPRTFRAVLGAGGVLTLLFVFVFLYAFTGEGNHRKNRVAFLVSYMVIFLSLGFPLVAPVALHYLWSDLPERMIGYPVGILVARVPHLEEEESMQWVLNIGAQSSPGKGYGEAEVHGGLVIPFYVFLLSILGGAINMTRQVPRLQVAKYEEESRPLLPPGAGAVVNRVKAFFSSGGEAEGEPAAEPGPQAEQPESVEGLGGGGATAAETSGASTMAPSPQPGATQAGTAGEPETPSSAASSGKGHPVTAVKRGAPVETDENAEVIQTMAWRKGLVDQYMYLFSAPFLAIATYYLLIWLELTKVPVLVLVSFSVGLISDKIVDAITSKVEGILGGGAAPVKKAGTPAPSSKGTGEPESTAIPTPAPNRQAPSSAGDPDPESHHE